MGHLLGDAVLTEPYARRAKMDCRGEYDQWTGRRTLASQSYQRILSDMTRPITAEARLRRKSQLTLPESVVEAAQVKVGDRFVVEVAPDDPDTIRLLRVRPTYAGALAEVYDEPEAYLAEERATWTR
jgi:hypothetical protein